MNFVLVLWLYCLISGVWILLWLSYLIKAHRLIIILDYIQTNHEYSFHTVLVKRFHVSRGLYIACSTLSYCVMFHVSRGLSIACSTLSYCVIFHVSRGLSIACSTLSHYVMFQVLDIGFQWVVFLHFQLNCICSLEILK